MIQELRIYRLRPGGVAAFIRAFDELAMPLVRKHMFLAGLWTTQIGDLNDVYIMWDYHDHAHRLELLATLHAEPGWQHFRSVAFVDVLSQHNTILEPAPFAPPSSSGLPHRP